MNSKYLRFVSLQGASRYAGIDVAHLHSHNSSQMIHRHRWRFRISGGWPLVVLIVRYNLTQQMAGKARHPRIRSTHQLRLPKPTRSKPPIKSNARTTFLTPCLFSDLKLCPSSTTSICHHSSGTSAGRCRTLIRDLGRLIIGVPAVCSLPYEAPV